MLIPKMQIALWVNAQKSVVPCRNIIQVPKMGFFGSWFLKEDVVA
jgi:hypothetical protein